MLHSVRYHNHFPEINCRKYYYFTILGHSQKINNYSTFQKILCLKKEQAFSACSQMIANLSQIVHSTSCIPSVCVSQRFILILSVSILTYPFLSDVSSHILFKSSYPNVCYVYHPSNALCFTVITLFSITYYYGATGHDQYTI